MRRHNIAAWASASRGGRSQSTCQPLAKRKRLLAPVGEHLGDLLLARGGGR